jgi:hypothetical protein
MQAASAIAHALQSVVEWVMLCGERRRRGPPARDRPPPRVSPFETATVWQLIYFSWANALLVRSADDAEPIQMDDVWPVHDAIASASAAAELRGRWEAEQAAAASARRPPSMRRAMWRSVRRDLAVTHVSIPRRTGGCRRNAPGATPRCVGAPERTG